MTDFDSLPVQGAVALTKSDSTTFAVTKAVYVGGAGNLNVTMADGSTAVFNGAVAGSVLPIRITQLLSTSTTATNVMALY